MLFLLKCNSVADEGFYRYAVDLLKVVELITNNVQN